MSSNPPPNPLSDVYVPSAWIDEDTAITKENIALYAVKFPISQNSPITISNTLSVGGLITGTTATATANDNSTKLASTGYADNSASQSASALLGDTNTWNGINTFLNNNNSFIGITPTQTAGDNSAKIASTQYADNSSSQSISALLGGTNDWTGVNIFNDNVFIGTGVVGGPGLLTCDQINSGNIIGTAPTQEINDNSTKLATTAYADTSSTNAKNALLVTLTGTDVTYSGNNTYQGTSTFQGDTTAVTQSGSDDTTKIATTAFAQERRLNILVGNNAYSGDNTYSGTTNLNGAVNATSANNFIAGSASGGEVQLNSKKTYIGTNGLGNTDNVSIANGTNTTGSFAVVGSPTLGGAYLRAVTVYINDFGTGSTSIGNSTGTTTIIGNTNLNGNITRNLLSVKRWGISGGGTDVDYGNPGNRIGSTNFRTSGTTSFNGVNASGGALASAWDNPNGLFTFPETGTYIIDIVLFSNGGKISSGVGAFAGGGGAFVDGNGFKYLFTDSLPNSAGTTINNATFLYCASAGNNFYIGSGGTGSCVIYTGGQHSSFTITKVG